LQIHGSLGFNKQVTASNNRTKGISVLSTDIKSWLLQSYLSKQNKQGKYNVIHFIINDTKIAPAGACTLAA
jgi:hypothetical protein